jgi:hypothetical protein
MLQYPYALSLLCILELAANVVARLWVVHTHPAGKHINRNPLVHLNTYGLQIVQAFPVLKSKRVDVCAVIRKTLPAVDNSYLLGYTFSIVLLRLVRLVLTSESEKHVVMSNTSAIVGRDVHNQTRQLRGHPLPCL